MANSETVINHSQKEKKDKFWSIFWTLLWLISLILLTLRIFVYQQVNVIGQSMEPNYHEGQMLIINRLDSELQRGQVVAFYEHTYMVENLTFVERTFPSLFPERSKFFLKRVIGLPGEQIEIVGSKVIIYNDQYPEGFVIDEDYLPQSTKNEMNDACGGSKNSNLYYLSKTKIPEEEYFLMGDNRCHSLDSRDTSHGTFSAESFFGQEEFRYWPFTKASIFQLPKYSYSEIDQDTILLLKEAQSLKKSQ